MGHGTSRLLGCVSYPEAVRLRHGLELSTGCSAEIRFRDLDHVVALEPLTVELRVLVGPDFLSVRVLLFGLREIALERCRVHVVEVDRLTLDDFILHWVVRIDSSAVL